jgi:hypothetical protein
MIHSKPETPTSWTVTGAGAHAVGYYNREQRVLQARERHRWGTTERTRSGEIATPMSYVVVHPNSVVFDGIHSGSVPVLALATAVDPVADLQSIDAPRRRIRWCRICMHRVAQHGTITPSEHNS